jgi:hypothetical protein
VNAEAVDMISAMPGTKLFYEPHINSINIVVNVKDKKPDVIVVN